MFYYQHYSLTEPLFIRNAALWDIVNFFSIDKAKKQGEMGVIIGDKRYWRKGIAYTAVKIVSNCIFVNMDIDRIYIETAETNKPALRLFNKLDFKKCGEYLEEDDFKFIVMEKRRISSFK